MKAKVPLEYGADEGDSPAKCLSFVKLIEVSPVPSYRSHCRHVESGCLGMQSKWEVGLFQSNIWVLDR